MMPGQERGEGEVGAGWSGSDEREGEREVEEGARERWSTAAGFPVNGERRPRANVQSGQETTSRPRAHVPPLLSSAPLRADLPSSPTLPLLLLLLLLLLFLLPAVWPKVKLLLLLLLLLVPATAPLSVERTQRNNISPHYVEK